MEGKERGNAGAPRFRVERRGEPDGPYIIGNSPSPLFFVSDRNKGLEVLSFVSVLK